MHPYNHLAKSFNYHTFIIILRWRFWYLLGSFLDFLSCLLFSWLLTLFIDILHLLLDTSYYFIWWQCTLSIDFIIILWIKYILVNCRDLYKYILKFWSLLKAALELHNCFPLLFIAKKLHILSILSFNNVANLECFLIKQL